MFDQIQAHPPAHSHGDQHSHAHEHEHAAEDHDHGWAPWRYVVLLVPVILFLLGLPNKPLQAPAVDVNLFRDVTQEAVQATQFVSAGPSCWDLTTLALGVAQGKQDPNK